MKSTTTTMMMMMAMVMVMVASQVSATSGHDHEDHVHGHHHHVHGDYHEHSILTDSTSSSSRDHSCKGCGSYFLAKIHGWLMVFGWIGCMVSAKLVASCAKDIWTFKVFGMEIWFQLHRTLAVLGLICIVPSWVIIFIYRGGFSQKPTQMVIGTTAVALIVMQTLFGYFRPEPKSPYRNVFNWIHWFSGNLALILALANILLSALKRCQEFKWLLLSCLMLYVFFWDFLKKLNQYRQYSGGKWIETLQHYSTIVAIFIIMSMSVAMLPFIFK